MNILNALGYGGIVAVVGMFIVFLGLIILIVCITIMGKIFQIVTKPKAKPAAAPATPAPAPVPVPVATPVVEEPQAGDDPQIIAAIAAAIAAFDGGNKTLVVRSVRRVSGWGSAARREQVYKF